MSGALAPHADEHEADIHRVPRRAPPGQTPAPHPLLALQRTAGNAALARALQREPWIVTPGVGLGPSLNLPPGALAKGSPVQEAIHDYVRELAKAGRFPPQSVAELVATARQRTFKTADGKIVKVGDELAAPAVEERLRAYAAESGLILQEHRKILDRQGVQAEAFAALSNAVGEPPEVKFGGDAMNLKVDMFGTVTAEAKAGGVKAEAEANAATKEISAKLEIAHLVRVDAKIGEADDHRWGKWEAGIKFSLSGELVTAQDIVRVVLAAQKSLHESATALRDGLAPSDVPKHGAEINSAVKDLAEAARKNAAQKGGVSLGAGLSGGPGGGIAATATLTWTF